MSYDTLMAQVLASAGVVEEIDSVLREKNRGVAPGTPSSRHREVPVQAHRSGGRGRIRAVRRVLPAGARPAGRRVVPERLRA
jgi:hypothetical protein